MRALEVFQATGRSLFSFRWPRTPRADMQFLLIGLERSAGRAVPRGSTRASSRMFDAGLLDEVEVTPGQGLRPDGSRDAGHRVPRAAADEARAARRSPRCETGSRRTRGGTPSGSSRFSAPCPGVCWMSPDDPARFAGADGGVRRREALDHGAGNPHSESAKRTHRAPVDTNNRKE